MRNHKLETTNHKLETSPSKNINSNTIPMTVETAHPQITKMFHKHILRDKIHKAHYMVQTPKFIHYQFITSIQLQTYLTFFLLSHTHPTFYDIPDTYIEPLPYVYNNHNNNPPFANTLAQSRDIHPHPSPITNNVHLHP